MGLNEKEIADLCIGLESMSQEQAESMADFIEKRIARTLQNYRVKP
jgi:hypothetical protein